MPEWQFIYLFIFIYFFYWGGEGYQFAKAVFYNRNCCITFNNKITGLDRYMEQVLIILEVHLHLPACNISKCSHKMSPMNGGAWSRNFSRPSSTSSWPLMENLLIMTPSRENSCMAQCSHCDTWLWLQAFGSMGREAGEPSRLDKPVLYTM